MDLLARLPRPELHQPTPRNLGQGCAAPTRSRLWVRRDSSGAIRLRTQSLQSSSCTPNRAVRASSHALSPLPRATYSHSASDGKRAPRRLMVLAAFRADARSIAVSAIKNGEIFVTRVGRDSSRISAARSSASMHRPRARVWRGRTSVDRRPIRTLPAGTATSVTSAPWCHMRPGPFASKASPSERASSVVTFLVSFGQRPGCAFFVAALLLGRLTLRFRMSFAHTSLAQLGPHRPGKRVEPLLGHLGPASPSSSPHRRTHPPRPVLGGVRWFQKCTAAFDSETSFLARTARSCSSFGSFTFNALATLRTTRSSKSISALTQLG